MIKGITSKIKSSRAQMPIKHDITAQKFAAAQLLHCISALSKSRKLKYLERLIWSICIYLKLYHYRYPIYIQSIWLKI